MRLKIGPRTYYTSTRTHIRNSKIQKKYIYILGTYVRIVYLVRVLVPGTRTYGTRDPFSNTDMLDTIRGCDVVGVVQRRTMYSQVCIIRRYVRFTQGTVPGIRTSTYSRARDYAKKEQFARHARQVEILHQQCKRVQSGVIRRTLNL